MANKTNVNTHACAGASGQTTAQGYFHFCILHQHSGLAHQLLRGLTMTESSEKHCVVTKKFNIEVQNIWDGDGGVDGGDTHISPHIIFEIGL